MKALLITGLGGVALLASFLMMGAAAGSFAIEDVLASGEAFRVSGLYLPILLLFLLAVAAKSAQFPLHVWLPDAMVAPTPVSAYLHSAAMVKAGIFLLVRFLPALASADWQAALLPLGTVTMIVGGLQAIRSWELKRILAYSTISQLGLLASAFGVLAVTGQEAGLLQLLNHALLKASLFLVAGIVTLTTGLKDIRHLGGLGRSMPLTAVACGLAALSLAGIPPLGGFLSKEVYYEAALLSGNPWMPLLAVLGGALTFAYSIRFFYAIFLRRGEAPGTGEPLTMAIPALILALLTLLLGILPSVASGLVSAYVHGGEGTPLNEMTAATLPGPLLMSLSSAGLGLVILWRYEGFAAFLNRAASALRHATPDAVYEGVVRTGRRACGTLGVLIQSGSLRRYTGLLLLFVAVVLLTPMRIPLPELPALQDTKGTVLALVLAAMVVFASLAAGLKDTLHAILSLSGMGFLLAMAFMLLNAPDLAMTQILVEMVLLVIFLVVLNRIPFRTLRPSRPRGPADLLLGLAIAVGVAYIVALSLSAFYFPSLALRYLDPSLVDLTGGRNVVNVVVTDFRAFDTLGEITVIGLASLAVYTLLRRWRAD
jgi:NADH:ubiquinone oxidoreductase subunit 5 (subunit L)/multisubunit Na+/H+ antiporter MnhA subunit